MYVYLTMLERFIRYLQFEKRYSSHTITSYRKDLEDFTSFLSSDFEIKDYSDATHHQMRAWLMHLTDHEMSPKSVNRKIASLKSFYKFLEREKYILTNPTDKIRSLKSPKKLPVFVQENQMNELDTILTFEETFQGLRDRAIIELLYGTGIRLSELINLKTTDINDTNNTIKVLGKGNKERIIPIHHELSGLLEKYSQEKEANFGNFGEFLIVTNDNKKTYPMFIFRTVNKYLSHVTTNEKRSPHTLRHTFATHLLNKGADLNAIKEMLGHSSLAATQVYTHNSVEKLKKIFEQAHPKA